MASVATKVNAPIDPEPTLFIAACCILGYETTINTDNLSAIAKNYPDE